MEFDEAVSKTSKSYLYKYYLGHEVSEEMTFEEYLNFMRSIGLEVTEDENVPE